MLDRLLFLAQDAAGEAVTEAATDAAADGAAAESAIELSPEQLALWAQLAVPYLIKAVGVLVLLFVVWMIANAASRRVVKLLGRTDFDVTLSKFFGKMAKWLILLVGVVAALGIFGVSTASFAAVIAAAGLAVGLAFQGTLSNFASGIMLLIFRPFVVGDTINAAGVMGKVDEIGIFTTTLDTPDNRRLIVPNSSVFGSTIENVSYHERRRVDIAVGTEYGADLDAARSVLTKAAEAIEGRLPGDPPAIVLTGLGASSIDWSVRVWVNKADFWDVKDRLARDVKVALDEAGIGIPFPQMDIHVDGSMVGAGAGA